MQKQHKKSQNERKKKPTEFLLCSSCATRFDKPKTEANGTLSVSHTNGINQEKLESYLVFIFQFFHLNFPAACFLPLPIQFATLKILYFFYIHGLLRNFSFSSIWICRVFFVAQFFDFYFFFFPYMCIFLARTKDKEVEISICSEYVINIFPWIKFVFFLSLQKVVLLLEILEIIFFFFAAMRLNRFRGWDAWHILQPASQPVSQ